MTDLIPPDVIKLQKPKEWLKSITSTYSSQSSLTREDAKVEFLKYIYKWPTFGSAFFEVKQTTEPNYPEYILIAINLKGVLVIHPQTKVSYKIVLSCFFFSIKFFFHKKIFFRISWQLMNIPKYRTGLPETHILT